MLFGLSTYFKKRPEATHNFAPNTSLNSLNDLSYSSSLLQGHCYSSVLSHRIVLFCFGIWNACVFYTLVPFLMLLNAFICTNYKVGGTLILWDAAPHLHPNDLHESGRSFPVTIRQTWVVVEINSTFSTLCWWECAPNEGGPASRTFLQFHSAG